MSISTLIHWFSTIIYFDSEKLKDALNRWYISTCLRIFWAKIYMWRGRDRKKRPRLFIRICMISCYQKIWNIKNVLRKITEVRLKLMDLKISSGMCFSCLLRESSVMNSPALVIILSIQRHHKIMTKLEDHFWKDGLQQY